MNLNPVGSDEWFEESVRPQIVNIQRQENGYYTISIALCYKRHEYYDKETKQKVTFAVFPKILVTPHMWEPNYAHAVKFLNELKEHLDSFKHNGPPIVNIKFYWSGADGPGEAMRQALYAPPVKGFAYFALPDNWSITFMKHKPHDNSYEEEKSILEYLRMQMR